MLSFVVTEESVVVMLNGYPVHYTKDNPLYNKVIYHLQNPMMTEERLIKVLQQEIEIKSKEIIINYNNGNVLVNDKPVHKELQKRITFFIERGLPITPLLRFIKKLYANPSEDSQHSLLDFLCHNNLPIHEDGDFLAYKAVRNDLMDIYTGTIKNEVGAMIFMSRSLVDNDRNVACSKGFHAGTIDYAKSYGNSESVILLVKINPKDVVSVPHDCSCQKLRTCAYTVYDVYKNDLSNPLYKDAETPIAGKYEKIKKFKQDAVDKTEKNGIIAWANQFGDIVCIDGHWGGCEKPNLHTEKPKTNTYNKRDSKGRFCK